MSKSTRLAKSFYRLLLPVVILLVAAIVTASVWFVHETAHPLNATYLMTPVKYGQLSSRGAQITEETWGNRDGTTARGWFLRGDANSPAVILLHKYGDDRSYVLNLGVKLNESTNFTVLMPDLRGHGQDPIVSYTSFGGCEADDTTAAIEFLRTQKTADGAALVGQNIGIYGLEMGALSALAAAPKDPSVKALVLDSVPQDSDALVASVTNRRYPFMSSLTSKLGQLGAYPYFYEGCYTRTSACDMAKSMNDRKVLLLAGIDAPEFQDSTSKLGRCFPASTIAETKTDLSPSGYTNINSSLEVAETYDRRVIDFFKTSLGSPGDAIVIASIGR